MRVATKVAQGLNALHRYGVIHGDISPDSILLFEYDDGYQAKISNFGHSVLDTGAELRLPSTESPYAAPESSQPAPASLLQQADVYSYGLVFASLFIDLDVFQIYSAESAKDPSAQLEKSKRDGTVLAKMVELASGPNDVGVSSQSRQSRIVTRVLELTLQRDPEKRDLQQVISALSGVYVATLWCANHS